MKVEIFYGKDDQTEQHQWGELEHVDTWDLYYFKYSENDIILISHSQAGAGTDVFPVNFIPDIHNVKKINMEEISKKLLKLAIGAIFR